MDFILNPLVTLLTFLYSVLGRDMVLSIVVFTVLVRLITYPLTAQQQRSSAAMQQLQPELRKLQEKYKNDREKLAQAQMELYREYKINPAAGCLPLFIQLPVFLALYQAIQFALAVTPVHLIDLSGRLLIPGLDSVIPMDNMWLGMNLTLPPDISTGSLLPLALPLLTVITTWLQFKVTMPPPPPSDDGKPNQAAAMTQSMSTIMPLMYGFFALSFSVGISIYFISSNVISIVQSVLMGKANFRNLFGGGRATPATANNAPPPAPAKVEGRARTVNNVRPARNGSSGNGRSPRNAASAPRNAQGRNRAK